MKRIRPTSFILLILILSFYLPVFFNLINILPIAEPLNSPDVPFNSPVFDPADVNQWKMSIQAADQNSNGINDQFEEKLDSLAELKISEEKTEESSFWLVDYPFNGDFDNSAKDSNNLSLDYVPIVINLPKGDFSAISLLFERLGGQIKSIYKTAINGFAGSIDYLGLYDFCDTLQRAEVPFLLEEDSIFEATLYFASRSMNLRPYVWNTLDYTGDEFGSIAIIDSGLDDTHNFFAPGYANGNFNYKIVGWQDEVEGQLLPYDDNGHGSHCGGIATGQGGSIMDPSERTVATDSLGVPGAFMPEQILNLTRARFCVTDPGLIEIHCQYLDSTAGVDKVNGWVFLYYEESIVDSYITNSSSWSHTLAYNATNSTLGDYSLRLSLEFDDQNGDGYIFNGIFQYKAEIHWPFYPDRLGGGDPWKGVAPDTHLVGVKVLSETGGGYLSDILDGINFVISNKTIYNITTISMSLGGPSGSTSIIQAVTNAVNNGIVTVVSAGNDGAGGNFVGSPGDADSVITVAAMNDADQVTDYSSQGGLAYGSSTIKPDIMAPGGSYYNYSMFSTDSNDNDAQGMYTDTSPNDILPALGTSMACPAVAGAATLLIEAMGGHPNWNYTAVEAKRVKALLLMTATETYPLTREMNPSFSPQLNRGGKDPHEGFGRINIDAALEAYTQELVLDGTKSAWLTSSLLNPFQKHALGCYMNLIAGQNYNFPLLVPPGADFDLHLYSHTPTPVGDPIMVAFSNTSGLGMDESISFCPTTSGRYYLVAKAISGSGYANVSHKLNQYAPLLSNGSVRPTTGNQSTLFNFSVIYSDQDNNPPGYVNLLINGTPQLMEMQNPSDFIYTDGCTYQYLTFLQPGIYNFSFQCTDGAYFNATSTFVGLNVIETVNLNPPLLTDGQVSPLRGYNVTTYRFSVNYTDMDNMAPREINVIINSTIYSMNKQDPLDSNYADGCIYAFNTLLNDRGTYNYFFNCTDGNFSANLGPFSGPSVETTALFDGLYVNHSFWLGSDGFSIISYTHVSGNVYSLLWDAMGAPNAMWDVDACTRVMTNSMGPLSLGNGFHTPFWILKNVSLGDSIQLAVDGEGDHTFNVSGITTTFLPGFGPVEVWILEDVAYPAAVAWYEKSTGFLLNGSFYYGFGYYTFDFIDTNLVFDYIPNLNSPELTQGSVDPTSGPQTTIFNFTVCYTDLDNDKPVYINAVINGTSFPMTQQDPSDSNYADGCVYQLLTYLQSGAYNYSFECADWQYSNSTGISYGLHVGHFNFNPPSLNEGNVFPNTGFDNFTMFQFTVNYSDADNNAPQSLYVIINSTPYLMTQKYPLDLNYMDGSLFIFETELIQRGNYSFSFECSDGKFPATIGPYTGPFVQWMPPFNLLRLDGTRIGTVITHGESNPRTKYPTIILELTLRGAVINDIASTIDLTLLSNYDIIWFDEVGSPMSASEVDAIEQWVQLGGQFIVTGDNVLSALDLTQKFNITYTPTPIMFGATTTAIFPHPITKGVNELTFPFAMSSLDVSLQPNAIVCAKYSSYDMIVAMDYGLGKFVIIADADLLTSSSLSDNHLLINNTFGWLGFISNYEPTLTNPSVNPSSGTQLTLFDFRINYTDSENNPAVLINVVINGTPYVMTKVNPLDNIYTDGCIYRCLTYLQPSNSNYTYSFECSDGKFFVKTTSYVDINVTESLNSNPPILVNGQVNPSIGFNGTSNFLFTVIYGDFDNNPPVYLNVTINSTSYAMIKQDPSDNIYLDGCIYYFNKSFEKAGTYSYYFNCSDSNFTASDGPYTNMRVLKCPLFNDMYLAHYFDLSTYGSGPSTMTYSQTSGNIYHGKWETLEVMTEWDVDIDTRIISNSVGSLSLGNGVHTPFWIYITVSIGDSVLIAVDGDGDHVFNVTGEIIQYIPGQGYLELWVLNDTTVFGGTAYYEKSTGVLYNGNFYFGGGAANYVFNYTSSNVQFTYQPNLYFPELTSPTVIPSTGNQTEPFNFSVIYTDLDDNAPVHINLVINGTVFSMQKQNPSDMNFTDGCVYQYINYLSPGRYNYSFTCNDSLHANSTLFYWLNVTAANLNDPIIFGGPVNPAISDNSTLFTFQAWYVDVDNDYPSYMNLTLNNSVTYTMLPVDPFDKNVMDGILFTFSTYLDFGYYQYRFNCSDGMRTNATGWFNGPEVNPFYKITLLLDDFEGDLSNWETIAGLWHLTDTNSSWPDPCHSPTHSMWFGQESTGTYDTGARARGDLTSVPFDLSSMNQSYLEFYHWRQSEPFFDYSLVYISTDGISWDLLYANDSMISPWEKVVLDLSAYCGNESVQIRFTFDSQDPMFNSYRGWLVDDITIYGKGDLVPTLLFPKNNANIVAGLVNFTWNSIELPCLPLNYTLQISNISDFSSILIETTNIHETPTETLMKILVNYSTGQYYWRVRPDYGPFNANWSNYFVFNIITYDFAPTLTEANVTPSMGDQFTQFNFTVVYSDQDNNPPLYVNLVINGTLYSMNPQNPLDLNYTDGCLYQFITYLSPASYNYSFECSDSVDTNSTTNYLLVVNEANTVPPWLISPSVSPTWGVNTTSFYYYVWYFEAENNFPTYINITINQTTYAMLPVNPLDDNAVDGLQYYFMTSHDFGIYQFQVNCSDGGFTNSTGWVPGPDVNAFYDSIVINEISAQMDYIEMHNYGPTRDMTGWTIQIYDRNVLYQTYTFPNGWVFNEDYTVVLIENVGTDTATILYTGWNIPWIDGSIAVGLFDATGAHVDWMQTSAFTGSKPSGVLWTQDIPLIINNNYAFRIRDPDRNRGSDWVVAASGSPTVLNPGQTGARLNLLSPASGSSQFTGVINFTWTSIEFPFGAVNYTLQISNATDFSYLFYNIENIPETSINTSILLDLDLTTGQYYWQVCPTFKEFNGDWSAYFTLNIVFNNATPNLLAGSVQPTSGNQLTQFNFSVFYVDQDNNSPVYVNVVINETVLSMVKQNPFDLNYTDGVLYYNLTYLTPGIYNYSFECFDGKYLNNTITYLGLQVNKSNLFSPNLTAAIVSPSIGNQYTIFNFSVIYTDADSNPPELIYVKINGTPYSMEQQDLTDMNFTDGCLFQYLRRLVPGTYNYSFECNDSQYANSTSTYWLTVNETNIFAPTLTLSSITPPTGDQYTQFNFTVTYADQDNNQPLFVNVLINGTPYLMGKQDSMDFNYTDGCVFLYATYLTQGIYTYSFECNDSIFINSTINYQHLVNESNLFTPGLISGNVTPSTGDQLTLFNFSVIYIDQDNNKPLYVNLILNGTSYTMVKQSPFDRNYTDGCIYQFTTLLSSAVYNYSFECNDSSYLNSTTTQVLIVTVANNFEPQLLNPQVTPTIGDNRLLYNFSVWYFDADNNFPTYVNLTINQTIYPMVRVDPLDDNTTDGVKFYFDTLLDYAYYQFQINCSDGVRTNATGWIVGPEVNPFYKTNLIIEDFEGIMLNWETISGLWHLTNTSSAWSNPCHSLNYSMWFGQELTGNYDTGSRAIGSLISVPLDLSTVTQAYLEFYHWMEGEMFWDTAYIYITTNSVDWELVYQNNVLVSPWERVFLNISGYCGNESVQLRFTFDSRDGFANNFRGWLVDDVIVYALGGISPNLLTPINNSINFQVLTEFMWSSLELPLGAINYTIQIANTSDFLNVLYELDTITETSNETLLNLLLNFAPGIYYWHVRPNFGPFSGNWSKYFIFDLQQNNFEPTLNLGAVLPSTGNTTTVFNFTVLYVDQDNNKPFFVNVIINGTPYNMTPQNPADLNYTDGCLYNFSTFLVPGNYTFSFECYDGIFINSTLPVGLEVILVNIVPPNLTSESVTPSTGDQYTQFNFSVIYTDFENQKPISINVVINGTSFSMRKQNISDVTYSDGCIYQYLTYLTPGTYNYSFECNDSLLFTSTTTFIGLVINESNFFEPSLTSEAVTPPAGSQYTEFNFSVIYSDVDNNAPVYINVIINGTSFQMNKTNPSDLNYTDGCLYQYLTYLIPGTYNYSFECNDSVFYRFTVTYIGFLVIRANLFAPNLVLGNVTPSMGNQLTQFNFSVIYIDLDNDEPVSINVLINGTSYTMTKQNPFDLNYTDGCIYQYFNFLSIDTPGFPATNLSLEYSFECNDGLWSNSTATFTGLEINIINNNAPILLNGTIFPFTGDQYTTFTIGIIYLDLDNNAPATIRILINGISYTMGKLNCSDLNYTDGCIFIYQTTLTPGYYIVFFESGDGMFFNSTSIPMNITVTETKEPVDDYYWLIYIFAGVAIAVISVGMIKSRRKKGRPAASLETVSIQPPKDEKILAPEIEVVKDEIAIAEELQFMCSNCTRTLKVEKLDRSTRYCPDCGKPIDLIRKCTECNEMMTIPHYIYPKYIGKSLQCPYCRTIFTLPVDEAAQAIPEEKLEEEEQYPPIYLQLAPDEFFCPSCQKVTRIEDPDSTKIHNCPTCSQALKRFLKCPECNHQIIFEQSQYLNYFGENIICPKCKEKQADDELSKIIERLRSDDTEKRVLAAELLGEIGNKKAGPFLIETLLYDKENHVRGMAAIALGMLGIESALPLLKRLVIEEQDSELKDCAKRAIKWIESRERYE